jgi:hypothetical protein
LEDVRVLDIILRGHNVDPAEPMTASEVDRNMLAALSNYSETRVEDAMAISDLAMDN